MQTCLAMPGLYMDGASQALASRAVAQEELEIWRGDASYGVEGYGPVSRKEPDIEAMDPWKIKEVWKLELVARTHTFDIGPSDEGYRAFLGLRSKRGLALSSELLVAQGRFDEAVEEYRALHAEFPDPRILWRIRQIEAKR